MGLCAWLQRKRLDRRMVEVGEAFYGLSGQFSALQEQPSQETLDARLAAVTEQLTAGYQDWADTVSQAARSPVAVLQSDASNSAAVPVVPASGVIRHQLQPGDRFPNIGDTVFSGDNLVGVAMGQADENAIVPVRLVSSVGGGGGYAPSVPFLSQLAPADHWEQELLGSREALAAWRNLKAADPTATLSVTYQEITWPRAEPVAICVFEFQGPSCRVEGRCPQELVPRALAAALEAVCGAEYVSAPHGVVFRQLGESVTGCIVAPSPREAAPEPERVPFPVPRPRAIRLAGDLQ